MGTIVIAGIHKLISRERATWQKVNSSGPSRT
jgi:hypothetical protein